MLFRLDKDTKNKGSIPKYNTTEVESIKVLYESLTRDSEVDSYVGHIISTNKRVDITISREQKYIQLDIKDLHLSYKYYIE